MIPSVGVLKVVRVLMNRVQIRTNKQKYFLKKLPTSHVKDLMETGIAIHEHVDPYIKITVPVRGGQDRQALKLLNLAKKLRDLFEMGRIHELDLKMPWNVLLDEDGCEAVTIGVIDAVQMEKKRIIVEELKTHKNVLTDGSPIPNPLAFTASRYQVRMYALMLQRFLEAVRLGCKDTKACYVYVTDDLPLSPNVLELMTPFQTLEELYGEVEKIVKKKYKGRKVVGAKVIHLSQTLTRRAIALEEETVVGFEDSPRLRLGILKRQLRPIEPWMISFSTSLL